MISVISLFRPFFSDPFSELNRVQREINRVLNTSELTSKQQGPIEPDTVGLWHPSMDICETNEHTIMKIELPGVLKEDINIELDKERARIVISGQRKLEKKDHKWLKNEILYGPFRRSMKVPDNLSEDKVHAKFENGVLCVCIPKEKKQEEVKKIHLQ